jgi:hypothetical protein
MAWISPGGRWLLYGISRGDYYLDGFYVDRSRRPMADKLSKAKSVRVSYNPRSPKESYISSRLQLSVLELVFHGIGRNMYINILCLLELE